MAGSKPYPRDCVGNYRHMAGWSPLWVPVRSERPHYFNALMGNSVAGCCLVPTLRCCPDSTSLQSSFSDPLGYLLMGLRVGGSKVLHICLSGAFSSVELPRTGFATQQSRVWFFINACRVGGGAAWCAFDVPCRLGRWDAAAGGEVGRLWVGVILGRDVVGARGHDDRRPDQRLPK